MPKRTKQGKRRDQRLEMNARLNGRVTRPSNDPPRIVPIPWNTLTLDSKQSLGDSVNTYQVTFSTLYTIWAAQNGVDVDLSAKIAFRVLGMQVWETKGNSLTLDVYDLFSGNSFIAQVEDDAGRNHWACAGYRYPDSQSHVVGAGSSENNIFTMSSVDGGELRFRVHVLWRFRYANLPTRSNLAVTTSMADLRI